jgi:hypothetical protein
MAAPASCFVEDCRCAAYDRFMRMHHSLYITSLLATSPLMAWHNVTALTLRLARSVEAKFGPAERGRGNLARDGEWWRRFELRLLASDDVVFAACSVVALVAAYREHRTAQPFLSPHHPEREWGYGQIIAVALLVTPVLTFIAGLLRKCKLFVFLHGDMALICMFCPIASFSNHDSG